MGARGTAHFLWMAGAYASYHTVQSTTSPTQGLSVGVDFRPLFMIRWSYGVERGPGWWDLTVDSLSLGLGVYWQEPRDGSFGADRGLEGGVGIGLPLFARANGLWLEPRGLLRWADAGTAAKPAALLLLSWHGVVRTSTYEQPRHAFPKP
jgi:hypothetical protein